MSMAVSSAASARSEPSSGTMIFSIVITPPPRVLAPLSHRESNPTARTAARENRRLGRHSSRGVRRRYLGGVRLPRPTAEDQPTLVSAIEPFQALAWRIALAKALLNSAGGLES